MPELLVVGGAMRGGTKLLQHLLDSHPRIQLMHRELRALRYADMATWAHCAAVHQSFISTMANVQDSRFRRQVYRYLRAILRGHGLHELTTVHRIHAAFVVALASGASRFVGDKYPDYVLLYPQFIHRPKTRCIFIHRDPRDVVASIHDRIHHGDWKGSRWTTRYDTIEKATEYWLTIMRALSDIRRLDTNVLVIGYEDLVLRSEGTMAAIAHHLDVDASGFDASIPVASSVGRYRERLTCEQVDAIERLAGPMMQAWGYTPAPPPDVPIVRASPGRADESSSSGLS